jgi:AcrR family transcriptional regulator
VSRDRQILDAAAKLFYERGYDAVGVDEIGQRAGVTGPAIYRHFSGKEEILATLFDEAMDTLLVHSGGSHDDPHAELEHLIRAHAQFAIDQRELVSVYAREDRSLAEPWRRRLHRRERQYADRWIRILARCYPDAPEDNLLTAAYAAIGLLLSVAHWPRVALRTADLDDLLARIVLDGLGALDQRVSS